MSEESGGRPLKDDKGQFILGHTGLGGRPKGSRNKLGEAFISALHDDFEEHGADTIARVRVEDPTAYVKVCASLLPKEIKVSTTDDLTDEQLEQRIAQLAAALGPLFDVAGTQRTSRGGEAEEGREPSRGLRTVQ